MELETVLLIEGGRMNGLGQIREPLLTWFRQNARSMPWRDNPLPYWVWVSEIMLQQTRVEAVRGYFSRFMEALPDIPSLAGAGEEQLLKLWEGLGYYNRVRNLQRTAGILCRDFGGMLPASYTELLALPGIGAYTAGAIASIAFGIPVPAVDGNVYRVLSRLLASYADTSTPAVKRAYQTLAADLVPEYAPGDFNQALMELGATVCLPNSPPMCLSCPVSAFCEAYKTGCALDLPLKAPKKDRRIEERTVVLVESQGQVLLFKREEKGLLSGMYEPLNLEGHLTGQEVAATLAVMGAGNARIEKFPSSKHLFSHVEWRMIGYRARCDHFLFENGVWVDRHSLQTDYALPSAFRTYRNLLFSPTDHTALGG